MFGCLLGPGSIDNLKGLLAYKQTPLPITFYGIKLIPIATITLIAYLRSYAFVT
jgi:hypothetical protein